MRPRVDVIVVGSGAGGAVTAHELARAGMSVVLLEEGGRFELRDYGKAPPDAMRRMYRRNGMTPILGRVPIGYVEGCMVGGSTEINSGFWHRASAETLLRWKVQFDLQDASEADLTPHFEWAETMLGVGRNLGPEPSATRLLRKGAELLNWSAQEVQRAAPRCQGTNRCAQGCPTGAKQGMSLRILPEAEKYGLQIISGFRVVQLIRDGRKVVGVLGRRQGEGRSEEWVRLDADHIFVCAGPTETPVLLARSGVRRNVGRSLRVHPYLKVAAEFGERLDAHEQVLPLTQVKEFAPDLSFGGAFFSPGQVALTLSENWPNNKAYMGAIRNMAHYYVGVRGTGRGSVRPTWMGDSASIRYELSTWDARTLSVGLAKLATLLLAAGARRVLPAVWGVAPIVSREDAVRWMDSMLPSDALSLVTVHAFSSCPIGERVERSAADSYGRVHGFRNLFVNDASILPDSPGINPQGIVMALARRNAQHFIERLG